MGKEINVNEAAQLKANDEAIFLDVREPEELAICSIEGALHIPMGEVPARLEAIPKDKPLVVFCHHGMRSMQVVQFLEARGFQQSVKMGGGIHAWAVHIYASLATY